MRRDWEDTPLERGERSKGKKTREGKKEREREVECCFNATGKYIVQPNKYL